jgi:hypothetical protein
VPGGTFPSPHRFCFLIGTSGPCRGECVWETQRQELNPDTWLVIRRPIAGVLDGQFNTGCLPRNVEALKYAPMRLFSQRTQNTSSNLLVDGSPNCQSSQTLASVAVVPQTVSNLPCRNLSQNTSSTQISSAFGADANCQVTRTSPTMLGFSSGRQAKSLLRGLVGLHLRHIKNSSSFLVK